jgi:predicted amidohydrolase
MYVAGTIGCQDPATGRLTNAALLFDRQGRLLGRYDKLHLYAPELHDYGVIPGEEVPVFETDFGRVAFMTCYDSWFPDVAELAALRGADILLFPNLGYDRRLMFARAADNGVFLVTSTRSGKYGVWTPSGLDIAEAASKSNRAEVYKDMVQLTREELGILFVSVDLNECANPEWQGGTRCPVPRGKRHSANQRVWLENEIEREKLRWWTE